MQRFSVHLPDDAATRAIGRSMASGIVPGLVVYLEGDLGAGKTTLVRGVLAGLGYAGKVKSPTFSLVEPYSVSRIDFYHFDLYRIKDPSGWADSGFRDYFDGRGVCFIEWPTQAPELIPSPDLEVHLHVSGRTGGRDVTIEATTRLGERCLQHLLDARSASTTEGSGEPS